jgi:hypothetical protein
LIAHDGHIAQGAEQGFGQIKLESGIIHMPNLPCYR